MEKREDLAQLTPVFGTAEPPSGLSGVLRRLAYRIPDHRASHWAALLIADRIDVLEHDPARVVAIAAAAVAAAAGLVALARKRG